MLRFDLIWGHRTINIKHHILKHHIPELPNNNNNTPFPPVLAQLRAEVRRPLQLALVLDLLAPATLYIYIYVYVYISLYLFLSISLYAYIYIYIYVCIRQGIHIYG